MQKVKLCVLQDKGIQTVLLTNQRKTVSVYQYRDAVVQAVWRVGGWSFHVTQSAPPLYQLHKKGIEPGSHYVIVLEGQRIRFCAEELCVNALCSHGHALVGVVHIGHSSTQELHLKSAGISLCHVLLQAKDTERELVDRASINGCYANGSRIIRHTVMPGDVIYLGNVMLLMGKDSIFVPGQIVDTRLPEIPYRKTIIEEREAGTAVCLTPEPVQKLAMEIELPLAKGIQENLPAILVLGPSTTMGLFSTVTGLFSFQPAAERKRDLLSVVPTLFMPLSMALGTIPWPLLSKRYERKQQCRKEEKRYYVYSCYLLEMKQRIQQAMQEETACLQHWYPPVPKFCVGFLVQKPYRLRCVNHADWLHVVLGQSSYPAGIHLQFPYISPMTQDMLLDKLHGLQVGQLRLENVPIVAGLRECQSLRLEGEQSVCIDTLLNILLQLVIQQPEKETRIRIAAGKALISREKLFCLSRLFADRWRLLVWDETSVGRYRRFLEAVVDDESIKDVTVCILEPCFTDSLQLPAHEKIH